VKIDRSWLIYVSHGRAAQIPAFFDERVAYGLTESIQQKQNPKYRNFLISFYFSHLTDKNSSERANREAQKVIQHWT